MFSELTTSRALHINHENQQHWIIFFLKSSGHSIDIKFLNQFDDLNNFNAFENLKTIYHYSIPNTKLFYPEPFVASPSFMHSDIWFVHILLYQYWLWFVFIFIIVFFFLTFLCTIRWCNMRVKPRRETRGVSRSKCGDLITATVPVSWATSIIVSESTDAIDYYDGFGTTELVIGIRAYQWGWEYYYPKDIDLNYNIKPNYAAFVGNSLKYNKTSDTSLNANNFWKFYQNKNNDTHVTPLLLTSALYNNSKLISFVNFSEFGLNKLSEINAFKRIKTFSKTFTSTLTFAPSNFLFTFKNLVTPYSGASNYLTSAIYGSTKQQNFLTHMSLNNNQTTFFGANSLTKLINIKQYAASSLPRTSSSNLPTSGATALYATPRASSLVSQNATPALFPALSNNVNKSTERSEIKDVTFKLLNVQFFNNSRLLESLNVEKIRQKSEILILKNNADSQRLLLNSSNFYKNKLAISTFSNNQSVGTSEKTIRNFLKITPQTLSLNYSIARSPLPGALAELSDLNWFKGNYSTFISTKARLGTSTTISALYGKKLSLEYPYSPITSNSSKTLNLLYDEIKTSSAKAPLLFQGKEELMPASLLSAYWGFYWNKSGAHLRFANLSQIERTLKNFYLPLFSFYYDYDFRNWQAYELLEDAFWEVTYPLYAHLEYLDVKQTATIPANFAKIDKLFNNKNRTLSAPNAVSAKKKVFQSNSYLNFFFVDDFFIKLGALNTKNFNYIATYQNFTSVEDSYDSSKGANYAFNSAHKLTALAPFTAPSAFSYSTVLDALRSDFADYFIFLDFTPQSAILANEAVASMLQSAISPLSDQTLRVSNTVNLRNTAKNAIVTYNAMQKVFKTRFDENRSHAKLLDLSNSYSTQPFVTASKTNYERLLGKNKTAFSSVSLYKNSFKSLFNDLYEIDSGLNFFFYDFPFLLAHKSDSSRYIWFDWFAKWGYYEVQPSSSSRYAVFGMPYFSKNFEFATNANEAMSESENYLIRIARSRRNYLPNWTHSPYFYLKNSFWQSENVLQNALTKPFSNELTSLHYSLTLAQWYWSSYSTASNSLPVFAPTNSNTNSYARTAVRNASSAQGYYSLLTNLGDILTKREYLVRELFFSKNKVINLLNVLANTPNNALFYDVKTFLDSNNLPLTTNEYSRDYSFAAFTNFRSSYLKTLAWLPFVDQIVSPIASYVTPAADTTTSGNSLILRNQYRPMRKGIVNMIRLHATGAMALPIEIRLQVLASSKDVIHSWAIPSAGIKIDCVPGYSSHRVMIFLVSGIYWGQCMEICGRYHHWMPIVVYFMKRDLFFLWCSHFIHLNPNTGWLGNNRTFADRTKPVSFDKTTWANEL